MFSLREYRRCSPAHPKSAIAWTERTGQSLYLRRENRHNTTHKRDRGSSPNVQVEIKSNGGWQVSRVRMVSLKTLQLPWSRRRTVVGRAEIFGMVRLVRCKLAAKTGSIGFTPPALCSSSKLARTRVLRGILC